MNCHFLVGPMPIYVNACFIKECTISGDFVSDTESVGLTVVTKYFRIGVRYLHQHRNFVVGLLEGLLKCAIERGILHDGG